MLFTEFPLLKRAWMERAKSSQFLLQPVKDIVAFHHRLFHHPSAQFWAIIFWITVGGAMGGETQRRTDKNWASGGGLCCSQRGTRCRAQKTHGGFWGKNEANYNQRWSLEKGKPEIGFSSTSDFLCTFWNWGRSRDSWERDCLKKIYWKRKIAFWLVTFRLHFDTYFWQLLITF